MLIVLDVCLPEIVPVTSFTGLCTARDSPRSPRAEASSDGLELRDAWITAAGHCAPPGNKPSPEELRNCRPFLERELELLTSVQVVVVSGEDRIRHLPVRLEGPRRDYRLAISGSAMMCFTAFVRRCCAHTIRASRTLRPGN